MDTKQTIRLTKDLLRQQKGRTFDDFSAAVYIEENYGIHVDWHITAYCLEQLSNCQEAKIIENGIHPAYVIN